MKYCIYQFEAVSIQDYVLSSGKMKSMVGASELLEAITGELLDATIHQMGLKVCDPESLTSKELNLTADEVIYPRRAGAVFLMVMTDVQLARQFAEVWPILVSNFAPGLRFSSTLKVEDCFKNAFKMVRQELDTQKNLPQTQFPESTPVTVRFAKTGEAQIQSPSSSHDGMDWTMKAKIENDFDSLSAKHLCDVAGNTKYRFPKEFEHKSSAEKKTQSFPFKSTDPGNHTVAIIHSDGNGLGGYLHKVFKTLNEQQSGQIIQAYSAFSVGLDKATQRAAQRATKWLIDVYEKDENLEHQDCVVLPMRPLILGGDDLTCIIRADYALGFIQCFTQAFEKETELFVSKIKKDFEEIFAELPPKLTCSSGALFIKSNQPFSQGYALAEELCASAKKHGRDIDSVSPPSLVSFLHTTNTLFDELEVQSEQELQTNQGQFMSCMPYAFSAGQGQQDLADLFTISECFSTSDTSKLNPSALRSYAGHLHQDADYAEVFWKRWKNRSMQDSNLNKVWSSFEAKWRQISQSNMIPVADIVAIHSLEMRNPYSTQKEAR